MFAVISPEKIEIPPGSVFQIPGSWDVYKVPEVWLFKSNQVTIYHLQNNSYIVNNFISYFPDIDI